MRKTTEKALLAFVNGQSCKIGNMIVKDGSMFLHGNEIARLTNGTLMLSDCGWQTVTTKDRLNAILSHYKLGYIQQVKGVWKFNGNDWKGQDFFSTTKQAFVGEVIKGL